MGFYPNIFLTKIKYKPLVEHLKLKVIHVEERLKTIVHLNPWSVQSWTACS